MARRVQEETGAEREGPLVAREEGETETLVRQEETLALDKRVEEAGKVRARKVVETERVERSVPVEREAVEIERIPAGSGDSGRVEPLPDGSISVPVFGEEIEVRKRVVVTERLRLGKRTVTDEETVAADLARERIDIEADEDVEINEVGAASERSEQGMSMIGDRYSAPGAQNQSRTQRRSAAGWLDRHDYDETRPFFWTSEFLTLLAAAAAVAICTAVFDNLDVWRGLILETALAGSYMLSRGFAKSGSEHRERGRW